MAKITPEQRLKLLELALLSHLNRKQSKIFKEPIERQRRPPSPTPTRPGCEELIKTCPNCGSKNILEPDVNHAIWLCDDCMAEFSEPLWSVWIDEKMRAKIEREAGRRARAAEIARIRDERWLQEEKKQKENLSESRHNKPTPKRAGLES